MDYCNPQSGQIGPIFYPKCYLSETFMSNMATQGPPEENVVHTGK